MAPKLGAILLLVVCVFAISVGGRAIDVLVTSRSATPSAISIDPLPDELTSRHVKISGYGPPRLFVQLSANKQEIGWASVREDGHFETTVTIPRGASRLSAMLLGLPGLSPDETIIRLPNWAAGAYQPELLDAAYVGYQWLWVYGYGIPNLQYGLRSEMDEPIEAAISADKYGIVDALVALPRGPAPAAVKISELPRLAGSVPHTGLESNLVVLRSLDLASFPVSRTVDISLPADTAQPGKVFARLLLPATYPPLQMLVLGTMPVGDFLNHVIGGWFSSRSPTGSAPSLTLQRQYDQYSVEIDLAEYFSSAAFTWPAAPAGLGSQPLLSGQDSLTVQLAQGRPDWFGSPIPDELTGTVVRWTGPHPLRADERRTLAFGRAEAPSAVTTDAATKSELDRNKTVAAALAEWERRASIFSELWAATIAVIPFVSVILIASYRPLGTPRAWHALATMATILLGLRLVVALESLVFRGARVLSDLVYGFVSVLLGSSTVWANLNDAFWLVLLTVLALGSASITARQTDLAAPVTVRPQRGPVLWARNLRLCYAILLALGLLCLAMRPLLLRDYVAFFWNQFMPALVERGASIGLRSLAMLTDNTLPADPLTGLRTALEFLHGRPAVASLSLLLSLAIALFPLGWRYVALTLALILLELRYIPIAAEDVQTSGSSVWLWFSQQSPWPYALTLFVTGVAAAARLIDQIAAPSVGRRLRWLLAAALVTVAISLPVVPARTAVIAAAAGITTFLAWVTARTAKDLVPSLDRPVLTWLSRPVVFLAFVVPSAVLLCWTLAAETTEKFLHLTNFMYELYTLLPFLMAGCLTLLMTEYVRSGAVDCIPDSAALWFSVLFFATFVVNQQSTWLSLPVPLLAAVLCARFLLLRSESDIVRLRRVLASGLLPSRGVLIRNALQLASTRARWKRVQNALAKQLEAAEVAPTEYASKLEMYRQYFEPTRAIRQRDAVEEIDLREAAFGLGSRDIMVNVATAIGLGAVLAIAPFASALYAYLPRGPAAPHPFLHIHIIVFVLSTLASWLLYAFFLGFYFTQLRGSSGLGKGVWLFVSLFIPYAILTLLQTPLLEDVQPFIFWSALLFLYCTLLGLGMDYWALRRNGQAPTDLTQVHNIPVLSTYASTAVAVGIPAIAAILNTKLVELVTFLVDIVVQVPVRPT